MKNIRKFKDFINEGYKPFENESPEDTVRCTWCCWSGEEDELISGKDEEGFYSGCPNCDKADSHLMDISDENNQKDEIIEEDGSGGGAAMAGAGTTSGMGNVASSQPASTPGAAVTGDGTTGSGDYGNPLFPTAQKDGGNTLGKKRGKKSKKDKKKESVIQNFIAQHKAGKTKNDSTTSDDGTTSSKMLSFSDFVNNDIKK